MKILKTLLFVFALFVSYSISAQVAVSTDGSSADGSAMLDVKSTNKGFLPPRMTAAEIENIVSPANGLMVYNTDDEKVYIFVSTGNAWKELNYGTGTIPAYTPPEIGDCIDDGVVFYIFQSGDAGYVVGETHGLIVHPFEGLVAWGCSGTDLPNVPSVPPASTPTDPETLVGTRIGDGETNTDGVISDCSTGSAADWCLSIGPEWFLPSRAELNELYKWYSTDVAGNNMLISNCGGVDFTTDLYFSSTEADANFVWSQSFFNGTQGGSDKVALFPVRAVRAF